MSQRTRLVVLIVICVALVGGTAGYLAVSRAAQQREVASAPPQVTTSLTAVSSQPHVVFRNTAIGPDYGRVAVVALTDPGGGRAFTEDSCDRVFAANGHTLCLASTQGLVTTYTAQVRADSGGPRVDLPLTGSPSRARLSSDAAFAATTSFIAGDSYASTNFSTRTVVTRLADRTSTDLENFALIHQGQRITPPERNYWGVTFAADDDRFYATVAFGGSTYLAQGQLSTATVTTLHADAECPSLSPDGTRVAYKTRGTRAPGDWRLAVMDLATGREVTLSESRSVDDQVEWLDSGRIIYGLPGEGTKAPESNVWVVPADGTGTPSILIEKAWSPAIVR